MWRCRSVQVILGMLNWHDRYSTLVSRIAYMSIFHLNLTRIAPTPSVFSVKVKKILECVCVNCGRLQANIVSRSPAFLYSLRAPPHQIFWGPSLQVSWRTPNPHRCAVLDKRCVLPPSLCETHILEIGMSITSI